MKPFQPDLNPQENKSNPQEIHKEFMKPLDEKEVVKKFENSVEDKKNNLYLLWSKELPNDLGYSIYGKKENGKLTSGIEFCLLENFRTKDQKLTSIFKFIQKESPNEEKNDWKLKHRIARSKDLGISGTDFLQQAEEYFKILKKNGLVDITGFQANASQPSTIEWLKKNNYKFRNKNKLDPSDYYDYQNGIVTLKNKDKYELIKVLDSQHNYMKDEYIVDKNWRTDKDNGEKWQQALQNNISENIIEIKKNAIYGTHEVDQMMDKGYIPRFYLEKDI